MRSAIVLVVVLSASGAAYAQQTLSLFRSGVVDEQGGYGVAYDRTFAPRWSVQASVAVERHPSYDYVFEDNGAITLVPRERLRTMPIDLVARYHWLNDTRWKPYAGLGAHYVAAPDADRRFRYRNHLEGAINGGTLFMLTHDLGLMLDSRTTNRRGRRSG